MTRRPPHDLPTTVAALCDVMESLAPTGLAQSWDNVGLLAGDPQAGVGSVLLCIDLTAAVVEEAVRRSADVVLAYHPPIFKPILSIRADSAGTDAAVYACIRHGIALYTTHTALDAADGGTNDVIAAFCGIARTEPLEYVDEPGVDDSKLVVFVPAGDVEKVADAVFAAGAGHIGDYSRCSYRIAGQGSFFGGETTHPTAGQRGKMEYVDEVRLETVVPSSRLAAVTAAMIGSHPYDEPAFDIVPLRPRQVRGIGRCGRLAHPTTLSKLARKLKRATHADLVQIVGAEEQPVERAVILVGAAGSLPFRGALASTDVIVTGEIRHHDALTIRRRGCSAIALGHWSSERPVLPSLAERIEALLPGVKVRVSEADIDPFRSV